MALTNAEKQRRWKQRNWVVLTWDAEDVAEKLMGMEDQGKLRKIVSYLKDHLKHPDRTSEERAIVFGRAGKVSLNGPLTKRQALEAVRNPSPPQGYSWLVEATTKDGKRWRNGVRLETKEEAEVYVEQFGRSDLEKGEGEPSYQTSRIIRSDSDEVNCSIIRKRKGDGPTLIFHDGHGHAAEWSVINAGEPGP